MWGWPSALSRLGHCGRYKPHPPRPGPSNVGEMRRCRQEVRPNGVSGGVSQEISVATEIWAGLGRGGPGGAGCGPAGRPGASRAHPNVGDLHRHAVEASVPTEISPEFGRFLRRATRRTELAQGVGARRTISHLAGIAWTPDLLRLIFGVRALAARHTNVSPPNDRFPSHREGNRPGVGFTNTSVRYRKQPLL
jgi:hypothetical protein